MKEDLIILADKLDKIGYYKEANSIDYLLSKLAADYSEAAEEAGLSREAYTALLQLAMRIGMSAECVSAINAATSEDSNLSQEEIQSLMELGCLEEDESGVAEEYASRANTATDVGIWMKEHPGLSALIFGITTVFIGMTATWVLNKIKRFFRRKLAKKKLKATQRLRALPSSGEQAFVAEEKPLTPEQMQALRESKGNKYLAAIAKGYVDVKIAHNLPSYQTIRVEYIDVSFNIVGFGADMNACPNVKVRVPIALFDSDSNLTFKVGDIRLVRLNFGSKIFGDSLISTQLKSKCQYFHGFENNLVIPEIKSIRFSNGADMAVRFVDGLDIYQGQTLNLNK